MAVRLLIPANSHREICRKVNAKSEIIKIKATNKNSDKAHQIVVGIIAGTLILPTCTTTNHFR